MHCVAGFFYWENRRDEFNSKKPVQVKFKMFIVFSFSLFNLDMTRKYNQQAALYSVDNQTHPFILPTKVGTGSTRRGITHPYASRQKSGQALQWGKWNSLSDLQYLIIIIRLTLNKFSIKNMLLTTYYLLLTSYFFLLPSAFFLSSNSIQISSFYDPAPAR